MLRRLFLLAVVALVTAGGCAQSDDLSTATEIVDQWHTAWVTNDAEAATALFTEDGVYLMDGRHQGHPAIYSYINRSTEGLTFAERLDDGTCTDSSTCVFATRVEWNGNTYLTDLAVDVDGDLASQIDHVTWVDANE